MAPKCPRCKTADRPLSKDTVSTKYECYCKPCSVEKQKAWRAKNKDYMREYKRKYKATVKARAEREDGHAQGIGSGQDLRRG